MSHHLPPTISSLLYIYHVRPIFGLISDQQFGFLPGRSTLTQLLSVTDEWVRAIDRGERVAAVFLDFYRAFDRVWHDGLLHKLGECGLHPSSLAWLINYLSDRSLSVQVCNTSTTSNPNTITAGVPQGSANFVRRLY